MKEQIGFDERRAIVPGSVWRSHQGYTCCVVCLGVMVPSTEPGLACQVLHDGAGNVFFCTIADFLGDADGEPTVPRFTRVEGE